MSAVGTVVARHADAGGRALEVAGQTRELGRTFGDADPDDPGRPGARKRTEPADLDLERLDLDRARKGRAQKTREVGLRDLAQELQRQVQVLRGNDPGPFRKDVGEPLGDASDEGPCGVGEIHGQERANGVTHPDPFRAPRRRGKVSASISIPSVLRRSQSSATWTVSCRLRTRSRMN